MRSWRITRSFPAPEREADREFAAAGGGANEHQVCDVGAGDEKQKADGGKKHDESETVIASDVSDERNHCGAPAVVCLRILLFETRGDTAEFGLGLRDGDSRFQQPNGIKKVGAARTGRVGDERVRRPQLSARRKIEICGHHANDGACNSIERERFAEDL